MAALLPSVHFCGVASWRENTAAMAMYRGCGLQTSDLHDVVFSVDFREDEQKRP